MNACKVCCFCLCIIFLWCDRSQTHTHTPKINKHNCQPYSDCFKFNHWQMLNCYILLIYDVIVFDRSQMLTFVFISFSVKLKFAFPTIWNKRQTFCLTKYPTISWKMHVLCTFCSLNGNVYYSIINVALCNPDWRDKKSQVKLCAITNSANVITKWNGNGAIFFLTSTFFVWTDDFNGNIEAKAQLFLFVAAAAVVVVDFFFCICSVAISFQANQKTIQNHIDQAAI